MPIFLLYHTYHYYAIVYTVLPDMKLIFGLGNPGPDYAGTRHNIGFLTLEALADECGVTFNEKGKFKAFVAECQLDDEKVLLVKPTTFYNLAGESYRAICDFYKLTPEATLIVHDELALPFGTVRARQGGTDAGNNGIKSVNQHGGEASKRLRVGIANDKRQLIGDTDFVLGRFTGEEAAALKDTILPKLVHMSREFATGNHPHTSHKLIDTAG